MPESNDRTTGYQKHYRRRCIVCDALFACSHYNASYCGSRCRKKESRRRAKERATLEADPAAMAAHLDRLDAIIEAALTGDNKNCE